MNRYAESPPITRGRVASPHQQRSVEEKNTPATPAYLQSLDAEAREQTAISSGRTKWTPEAVLALGVHTDLVTAGALLGIGRTKTHELARRNEFPVPVLRHGRRYIVPVAPIAQLLQLAEPNHSGENTGTA